MDSLSSCFEFLASSVFIKVINQSPAQLLLSLHPEKNHCPSMCCSVCNSEVSSCRAGCRGLTTTKDEEKQSRVNEWPMISAGRGLEETLSCQLCGQGRLLMRGHLSRDLNEGRRETWNVLAEHSRMSGQEGLGSHSGSIQPKYPWWCPRGQRLHW